jgi:hypothetical protein
MTSAQAVPITMTARAHMGGDESIILEDRYGDIGGADPQYLTDECEGRRIQDVVQLDVAIAMQLQAMPIPHVRGHFGQLAHQGLLDPEAFQGLLASGAVNVSSGFLQHPTTCLLVRFCQVPESADREEIAL